MPSAFRTLLDRLPEGVGLTLDAEACRVLRDELGERPDLTGERLVGVRDAAFVAGCSTATMRRKMATGAVKGARKRGKSWRVSEADLLSFVRHDASEEDATTSRLSTWRAKRAG